MNTILVLKAWSGRFSFRLLDRLVVNKYAGYIGRISYGIYVYHYMIRSFIDDFFITPFLATAGPNQWGLYAWFLDHPGIIRIISGSLLTITAAHLSYTYVERPLLSLKDKFFPYPAGYPRKVAHGNFQRL